jgi:hypothetical protein
VKATRDYASSSWSALGPSFYFWPPSDLVLSVQAWLGAGLALLLVLRVLHRS